MRDEPRPLSPNNIYWRDVKAHNNIYRSEANKQYHIIDRGTCWEAHLNEVPKGVIYWMGQEAKEAQRYLRDNQRLNQKDVDPNA